MNDKWSKVREFNYIHIIISYSRTSQIISTVFYGFIVATAVNVTGTTVGLIYLFDHLQCFLLWALLLIFERWFCSVLCFSMRYWSCTLDIKKKIFFTIFVAAFWKLSFPFVFAHSRITFLNRSSDCDLFSVRYIS